MNDYEQKCVALDKELAELLGWTNVREIPYWDSILGNDKRYCGNPNGIWPEVWLPRWTQDNNSAFDIMVEYGLNISQGPYGITIYNNIESDVRLSSLEYKDFTDKQSTVRFAVVKSVINKLKGNV